MHPIPLLSIESSLHESPTQLKFLSILKPDRNSLLPSGIFSHSDQIGAPRSNVLTSSDRFPLSMPLPEPYPHTSLVLCFLELGTSVIQSLDSQRLSDPSVVEFAEGLTIPHVPHTLQLVDSLSTVLHFLLLADSFLGLEFICQILVVIHDVLTFKDHVSMHNLVLLSLHFVECLGESEFVDGPDSLLHLVQNILVVGDILAPSLQGVTLSATPHIIEEPHGGNLCLSIHSLRQGLLLILKSISLRDLGLEHIPGRLKPHLSIVEFDGIEALLQESLGLHSKDVLH